MKLQGIVASGVGQGAQFLALDWVRRELQEKLGLIPFPGTLNLRAAPAVRDALFAQRQQFVRIIDPVWDPSSPECPGYLTQVTLRANGRSCHSAWLILPEKTIHADTLEIISAQNLRDALALYDGDAVAIELQSEPRQ